MYSRRCWFQAASRSTPGCKSPERPTVCSQNQLLLRLGSSPVQPWLVGLSCSGVSPQSTRSSVPFLPGAHQRRPIDAPFPPSKNKKSLKKKNQPCEVGRTFPFEGLARESGFIQAHARTWCGSSGPPDPSFTQAC